jgi:VIT1/CCC1 family predicted Fe2+/Mn2+ transporter
VADGLSDAIAIHIAEESEVEEGRSKHTHAEVWLTTVLLFLIECGVRLTFTIPIFFFPLQTAVLLCVAWGIFLLIMLNFYTAKIKNENPLVLISGHLSLAVFVIAVSYAVGRLVAILLK